MRISRFLYGISIAFLSIMLSCQDANNTAPSAQLSDDTGYDGRIANIFNFIKDSGIDINADSCNKIIVLQTKMCNSCNKDSRKALFDRLTAEGKPVFFILAGKDAEIESQIRELDPGAKIYIDDKELLGQYNLSFLKNIEINSCKGKVIKWAFV